VDTGAIYSIFPHHSSSLQSGPLFDGPEWQAERIPCWDEEGLGLSCWPMCSFPVSHHWWIFAQPQAVNRPSGEPPGRQMVASVICTTGRPAVATAKGVLGGVLLRVQGGTVGKDIEHLIKTIGLPIASCFRRLAADKLAAKKFLKVDKDGIVKWSASPCMVVAATHETRKLTNLSLISTRPCPPQ